MQKGIIGKKIGMTQIFDENGKVVPVTVVEAGPCMVVQKKTVESDGYEAVQLGYGDISAKKVTKPAKGHFDKGGRRAQEARCVSSAWTTCSAHERRRHHQGRRVRRGRPHRRCRAPARARATPAPSSAGTSTACSESHGTGPVRAPRRFHGRLLRPRPASSRARRLPGHLGAERVTVQNLDGRQGGRRKQSDRYQRRDPRPQGRRGLHH